LYLIAPAPIERDVDRQIDTRGPLSRSRSPGG
jgi:hypothetical protein